MILNPMPMAVTHSPGFDTPSELIVLPKRLYLVLLTEAPERAHAQDKNTNRNMFTPMMTVDWGPRSAGHQNNTFTLQHHTFAGDGTNYNPIIVSM